MNDLSGNVQCSGPQLEVCASCCPAGHNASPYHRASSDQLQKWMPFRAVQLPEALTVCCRKWLDTHLKDQWYMGKPVVIEEFGKALGESPSSAELLKAPQH